MHQVRLACSDLLFRIFFYILASKLLLFSYIAGFDTESFLPSVGAVFVGLSLSLLWKNDIVKLACLFSLDVLFSLIFFTNSLYLDYFDDFATAFDLAQAHQLPAVAGMVIKRIGLNLFFIVDFIFLPLLFKLRKRQVRIVAGGTQASAVLLMIGLLFNLNPLILLLRTGGSVAGTILDRHLFVKKMGVINYQFLDIYNYLRTGMDKEKISDEDIRIIENWARAKRKSAGSGNELTGSGKGMNLIVIQVESLQNFVIRRSYKGNEITPNLNKLTREGIYFHNFYDHTAAGNSSDAEFLANASLYPSRRGAVSFLYPHNDYDSLPKVLGEHGYSTAVMEAYEKQFWNYEVFDKTLGFSHGFYENDFVLNDRLGWGLSDKAFFSQGMGKIKALPTPFYVLLRTLSSHGPFDAVTREVDHYPLYEIEGSLIGNYIRSIHYVDSAIGEFLGLLSRNHLLSRTVIAIYGDHRARLTSNDLERINVLDLEEKKKIPLIIYVPGRNHKEERDTLAGLIDLAPTLCNILGIDVSDKFFVGRDLGYTRRGFVIFRDGSYVGDRGSFEESAKERLKISDTILEKDMISLFRKRKDDGG